MISAALLASAACRPAAAITHGAEADFVVVRGSYTVVLLKPQLMQTLFGPGWQTASLFYGFNRSQSPQGAGILSSQTPLSPLAKGQPILVLPWTRPDPILTPLYALESRKMAVLELSVVKGTVAGVSPAVERRGTPQLLPNGTLVFVEQIP